MATMDVSGISHRDSSPNRAPELLTRVAQIISNKKGFSIAAFDIRGQSNLTDYTLVATGNIDRHLHAIASEVISLLKKEGIAPLFTDGLQEGDWVVLDYGSFMLHLLIPYLRDHYRLEELWGRKSRVDLDIDECDDEGGIREEDMGL